MWKLERENGRVLQLDCNGEVLNITIGGLKMYRKVIEAQGRFVDIQQKIENMQKAGNGYSDELLEFIGNTIIYLFNVSFGEANTKKICEFYEDNYDEMMKQVMPFFNQEFLPALREVAKIDSKRQADKLVKKNVP